VRVWAASPAKTAETRATEKKPVQGNECLPVIPGVGGWPKTTPGADSALTQNQPFSGCGSFPYRFARGESLRQKAEIFFMNPGGRASVQRDRGPPWGKNPGLEGREEEKGGQGWQGGQGGPNRVRRSHRPVKQTRHRGASTPHLSGPFGGASRGLPGQALEFVNFSPTQTPVSPEGKIRPACGPFRSGGAECFRPPVAGGRVSLTRPKPNYVGKSFCRGGAARRRKKPTEPFWAKKKPGSGQKFLAKPGKGRGAQLKRTHRFFPENLGGRGTGGPICWDILAWGWSAKPERAGQPYFLARWWRGGLYSPRWGGRSPGRCGVRGSRNPPIGGARRGRFPTRLGKTGLGETEKGAEGKVDPPHRGGISVGHAKKQGGRGITSPTPGRGSGLYGGGDGWFSDRDGNQEKSGP